jgi:hypothetical protein
MSNLGRKKPLMVADNTEFLDTSALPTIKVTISSVITRGNSEI